MQGNNIIPSYFIHIIDLLFGDKAALHCLCYNYVGSKEFFFCLTFQGSKLRSWVIASLKIWAISISLLKGAINNWITDQTFNRIYIFYFIFFKDQIWLFTCLYLLLVNHFICTQLLFLPFWMKLEGKDLPYNIIYRKRDASMESKIRDGVNIKRYVGLLSSIRIMLSQLDVLG